MPPRHRPEPEQEEQFGGEGAEGGEDAQQFQPPGPCAPHINVRNLDSYMFEVLSKFDRPTFFSFKT